MKAWHTAFGVVDHADVEAAAPTADLYREELEKERHWWRRIWLDCDAEYRVWFRQRAAAIELAYKRWATPAK